MHEVHKVLDGLHQLPVHQPLYYKHQLKDRGGQGLVMSDTPCSEAHINIALMPTRTVKSRDSEYYSIYM